jgi:hypothetical protein
VRGLVQLHSQRGNGRSVGLANNSGSCV